MSQYLEFTLDNPTIAAELPAEMVGVLELCVALTLGIVDPIQLHIVHDGYDGRVLVGELTTGYFQFHIHVGNIPEREYYFLFLSFIDGIITTSKCPDHVSIVHLGILCDDGVDEVVLPDIVYVFVTDSHRLIHCLFYGFGGLSGHLYFQGHCTYQPYTLTVLVKIIRDIELEHILTNLFNSANTTIRMLVRIKFIDEFTVG